MLFIMLRKFSSVLGLLKVYRERVLDFGSDFSALVEMVLCFLFVLQV